MQKILLFMIFTACCAVPALAQDDYNKVNFYVGYSNNRVDTDEDREGFNGFNTSITGNVSRYVGIKGDYSYHRKSETESGVTGKATIQNFLGGVQFKDNSKDKKFKPFAHVLAGVARVSANINDSSGSLGSSGAQVFSESNTGFAMVFGGGVDIRAGKRVDVRVIQLDYNPNRFDGSFQHNFRVGFGIVFK
jgi:hypothetical protein